MKNIYLILLILVVSSNVSAQSYEEWKLSQQNSYENYQQRYLARYNAYKAEVAEKWGEYAALSGAHDYVLYKKDLLQRVILDYENNQILIESLNDQALDVKAVLSQLASISVGTALATDPVLPKVNESASEDSLLHTLTGSDDVAAVMAQVTVKKTDRSATSKRIQQVKVSLPAKMVVQRATPFLPSVIKMSKQFDIDRSLILAITQTESSFNPLAQSPIPAFGLMQIVPDSAGKDVNMHINNKKTSPTINTLFKPDQNIRFGAAYLHILDSRYLKGITDDRSRLYCTIAAYNTGAGNVASVFHPQKKRSLKLAVQRINQLSPDEVYQQLVTHLPYQETRTYLKKVNKALQQYQQWDQSKVALNAEL